MDLFYITVSMPGHLPMPSKCPPKAITNKQTNKQTNTHGGISTFSRDCNGPRVAQG